INLIFELLQMQAVNVSQGLDLNAALDTVSDLSEAQRTEALRVLGRLHRSVWGQAFENPPVSAEEVMRQINRIFETEVSRWALILQIMHVIVLVWLREPIQMPATVSILLLGTVLLQRKNGGTLQALLGWGFPARFPQLGLTCLFLVIPFAVYVLTANVL
ncbi:hypothetical protein Vretimale_2960, partial [Volvox reticuliferus]